MKKKNLFTHTKNYKGTESKSIANMLIFSKFISKAHETNGEICVAYEEYDINSITPISKIINIED